MSFSPIPISTLIVIKACGGILLSSIPRFVGTIPGGTLFAIDGLCPGMLLPAGEFGPLGDRPSCCCCGNAPGGACPCGGGAPGICPGGPFGGSIPPPRICVSGAFVPTPPPAIPPGPGCGPPGPGP